MWQTRICAIHITNRILFLLAKTEPGVSNAGTLLFQRCLIKDSTGRLLSRKAYIPTVLG